MSEWYRETSFLLDYPSRAEYPVILVIGALVGVIAKLLLDQHPEADHHLFEPQDWACERLREKFGDRPNVHIHQFGLGDQNGIFQMGLYRSDSCSFMRGLIPLKDGTWFDGELKEFEQCMGELGIEGIYYASINIEAYELVLLPHMARVGWLERCETIGISWHDDIKKTTDYAGPYSWLGHKVPGSWAMQDILGETHKKVLELDNWQSWARK